MNSRQAHGRHGLGVGGFILLAALSGLSPLTSVFILPALPELADDLHTSLSGAQFALSAGFAGLAVGLLMVGPLSDRHGRRAPLILGLVAYIATTVLCSFASDIATLIVFRALQGVCGGAVWVITRAVVRDSYAGQATARVLSQMSMVTALAPVVAPSLAGQLLLFTDWRGLFLALAAFGAVVMSMGVLFMRETLLVERRQNNDLRAQLAVIHGFFRAPYYFLSFAALGVVQSAMYFTFVIMSPFVFVDDFGMTAQQFGMLFGVAALMMALGNQSNVLLLRRWRPETVLRLLLTIAFVGSVAYLVAVVLHAPLSLVIVAVLLVPLAAGASNADITALTLAPFPHAAGSAAALLGACQFGVAALVPPLVSLAGVSALSMALTMLVTAVGAWWIGMAMRARWGLPADPDPVAA
ncbi:Bcr/CflA family drug resistance efflux transporter [Sinomonas cellulolyticus]|uniref:Multidrug effflux MFS transporter n=1 Tax=Sinomonas cellulolyticus TaxID=2801916 RepID=A0ABS1K6V8_9MICC|nr:MULTISPECIES: multidrug effflux MFS transporter [Sinomonas]MBL0707193.1 multidrug effflux MFS transporter [Sinomonas cellulolyticus]GHG49962.1 Bcr/CflA family drug resistance efflux transporter [Sinomonas sp. KCTC 49339]